MGPNDYSIDVQTPFQAALQGYQLGAAIRDDQAQQQQRLQAQQQQQQMSADFAAVVNNPNARPRDIAALMVKYPSLAEKLNAPLKAMSDEERRSRVSFASQVYAAGLNDRPDVALQLIDQRRQALLNSGGPKDELQHLDNWKAAIDQNPHGVRNITGAMLAAEDPEKFAGTFSTLGTEARADQQGPADLAKKQADARAAQAAADVAREKERLGLLRAGADLGLTEAQTQEALKRTQKLSIETQKAALELAGGGDIDPEKRFNFERQLRQEYNDQTKGFQEVQEAYRRIQASKNDAAGDLSLIFAYMKMLDPGSVVREGEFANAQNAAGVPDRVLNIYNKIASGERLTEGQRRGFTSQAKALMDAAQQREKTVRGGIDQVVKSYRLNPDNVFYTPAAQTSSGPGAPSAAVPSKYQGRKWTQY